MRYLLVFLAVLLFSRSVYIPKGFEFHFTKDYQIKTYNSLNEVDFNNSFLVLKNKYLPFILQKNLKIISGIKPQRDIIVSKKHFTKIKTIANIDLPTKIFLSVFNQKFTFTKGTLADLENNKIDAILSHKKIKGFYNYDLSDFGIEFHKYYLVTTQEFEKRNDSDAEFLKEYLIDKGLSNFSLLSKNLIIYGLYFKKRLNIINLMDTKYFDLKNDKDNLKVILTPSWPPFNFIQDNRLVGIGTDMWRLIAKKAGLNYTVKTELIWLEVLNAIKDKKADITPNTSETPDRKKYAIFSKPYMEFPYAIICRANEDIKNTKDIKNIAVGYHYTAHMEMMKHYPNINYIGAKNVVEAIRLVENGKAQCAVDMLPVVAYVVNKNHFVNLEVKFLTPFTFKLQVMLRKDLKDLKNKIDSAIDEISDEQKQEIINKYVSISIIKKDTNRYLMLFLAVAVLFIIGLVYFYIKTKREALFDELTEILNRRGFDKTTKGLKRGSIIFMDLDHFKDINDTYGHEFGDFVLKEFATVIKENIRDTDIFARIGGEEFILVLPNTSYLHAYYVAEKLRKIIANHNFKNVKLTASFGISEFEGNLEKAINRADEALYEAKNNGRNQVKGKQ